MDTPVTPRLCEKCKQVHPLKQVKMLYADGPLVEVIQMAWMCELCRMQLQRIIRYLIGKEES